MGFYLQIMQPQIQPYIRLDALKLLLLLLLIYLLFSGDLITLQQRFEAKSLLKWHHLCLANLFHR